MKVVTPLPASVWHPTIENAIALDQAAGAEFGTYLAFRDALALYFNWQHKPECVNYWDREVDRLARQLYDLDSWKRDEFIRQYLVNLITR